MGRRPGFGPGTTAYQYIVAVPKNLGNGKFGSKIADPHLACVGLFTVHYGSLRQFYELLL